MENVLMLSPREGFVKGFCTFRQTLSYRCCPPLSGNPLITRKPPYARDRKQARHSSHQSPVETGPRARKRMRNRRSPQTA